MTEYDDLVIFYAIYKATPPDCEDEVVNRTISMKLSDAEQKCILEQAEEQAPIETWREQAAEYFQGRNIYYRNSRWTDNSTLVCVDTGSGLEGWLSRTSDEGESAGK